MDQRRIIIAGVIALVAALFVLGVIFLLGNLLSSDNTEEPALSDLPVISSEETLTPDVRFTDGEENTPTPAESEPTATPEPEREATNTPTPTPREDDTPPVASDTKVYNGEGFSLNYPSSWGLLSCSNSTHFEIDPTNSDDQLEVSCNIALKPVTVLVKSDSVSCPGTTVTLGSHQVKKSSRTFSDGDIYYRWCVQTADKTLDISHRYSANGGRATSTTDYSSQVEDLIKTISP